MTYETAQRLATAAHRKLVEDSAREVGPCQPATATLQRGPVPATVGASGTHRGVWHYGQFYCAPDCPACAPEAQSDYVRAAESRCAARKKNMRVKEWDAKAAVVD